MKLTSSLINSPKAATVFNNLKISQESIRNRIKSSKALLQNSDSKASRVNSLLPLSQNQNEYEKLVKEQHDFCLLLEQFVRRKSVSELIKIEKHHAAIERQIKMERENLDKARFNLIQKLQYFAGTSIYPLGTALKKKSIQSRLVVFHSELTRILEKKQKQDDEKSLLNIFLKSVNCEIFSGILLAKIFSLLKFNPEGVPIVSVAKALGEKLLLETKIEIAADEIDEETSIMLGLDLVNLVRQNLKLREGAKNEYAFRNISKPYKSYGLFTWHDSLRNVFEGSEEFLYDISEPVFNAMLTAPKNWTHEQSGGYFLKNNDMIMNSFNKRKQLQAVQIMSYYSEFFLSALNIWGSVEWTLNNDIYIVADEVRSKDLKLGKFVGKIRPRAIPTLSKKPSREELARISTEKRELSAQQSKRGSFILKLDRAKELLELSKDENGVPTFYFPYQLDFRGRAYPMPTHFSHLQDDFARSLLLFKRKKPLGKTGLRWLKVHLAGMFGVDKVSFDERVAWVDERIKEGKIEDCAKSPIDRSNPSVQKWWNSAEKPWQALAVIFELNKALNSANVEEFESGFPIHQDGSCNGLQHYAAMGKDYDTAVQVNLIPGEKPSDVYSQVCKEVKEKVRSMANAFVERNKENLPSLQLEESGIRLKSEQFLSSEENRDLFLSFLVQNKIIRKVVKQTVMTKVYGVTNLGAKEQIKARLVEINEKIVERHGKRGPGCFVDNGELADTILLTEKELNLCGVLLAKLTLDSIKTKFPSPDKIMKWLKDVATVLVDHNLPVSWLTPSGFPVEQNYRIKKTKQVYSQDANWSVTFSLQDCETSEINAIKQKTAFAPNFVHSIDASHLVFTSVSCAKEDVTIAAVHDSYWTHASDVGKMSKILREEFVKLHEKNVLEDLRQQIFQRIPQLDKKLIPPPPTQETFDLKTVVDSLYFFN